MSRRQGFAVSLLAAIALVWGCGQEQRSERLYRQAGALIERGEYEQAVSSLERILRDYPDTPAAKKAREDVVLYGGIVESVRSYPLRKSTGSLIEVARALERFRDRHRRWPESLAELVPRELAQVPEDGWGHALFYERESGGGGYLLGSFGADGAAAGSAEAADVVVEDGKFSQRELPKRPEVQPPPAGQGTSSGPSTSKAPAGQLTSSTSGR